MTIIRWVKSSVASNIREGSVVKRLFYGALWGGLLIGGLLIVLERRENGAVRTELVAIRESMLTEFTSDPNVLELDPQQLIRAGFHCDRPKQVAKFRSRLLRIPHYAHALAEIDGTHDEIQKAQRIVLSFSAGGAGAAIYRLPLLQKMQRTLRG